MCWCMGNCFPLPHPSSSLTRNHISQSNVIYNMPFVNLAALACQRSCVCERYRASVKQEERNWQWDERMRHVWKKEIIIQYWSIDHLISPLINWFTNTLVIYLPNTVTKHQLSQHIFIRHDQLFFFLNVALMKISCICKEEEGAVRYHGTKRLCLPTWMWYLINRTDLGPYSWLSLAVVHCQC